MGILRFLLALSVVIGHADHSLGIPSLNSTVAVRSFYIISGFYMALVLNTKYKDKSYYVFLRGRYLRLFPAYFVTFALTCVYGFLAYSIRGTVEWPFQGWSRTLADLDAKSIFALSFSNIFMVGQDLLTYFHFDKAGAFRLALSGLQENARFSGYMFIPQAWTLGVELLFYMTAPLLAVRGTIFILGIILASLAGKFFFLPAVGLDPDAFGYRFFPFEIVYFLLGMLSHKLYVKIKYENLNKPQYVMVPVVLFLAFASIQSSSYAWAGYLALASCIPFLFWFTKENKADRLIGELSYPAYIIHILVLYALMQFSKGGTEGPVIIITVFLSALMFWFVDRPLDRWREKLAAANPHRRFPSTKTLAAGCALAACATLVVPLAVRHVFQERHLEESLPLADYDLLDGTPAKLVTVGLEPEESAGKNRWRWGFGPKTELIFSLPKPTNITLTLEYSPLPMRQTVSITFNGIPLETLTTSQAGTVFRQYTLPGRKENNVIRFVYQDWNGKRVSYVSEDSRPLAAMFNRLVMSFTPTNEVLLP